MKMTGGKGPRARGRLLARAVLAWGVAGLLALAGVSGPTVRADTPGDLATRADEAFRAERYDEAIDLYRQVVEASPSDAVALARLARVLSWENRLDESIAAWKRLVALTPDDGAAKLGLAETLGWAGRYDEARAIYDDLIARKDHSVEAGAGMGDLAAWEGNLSEATRWYRQVLQADENNERAAVGIARVHHWQGMDRAALQESELAVERFPHSRDAARVHEEIEDSLRPLLVPYYGRTLDSDTNDWQQSRLTFTIHSDPQTTAGFVLMRNEASFRCEPQKKPFGKGEPFAVDDLCPTEPVGSIVSTEAHSVAGFASTRFGSFLTLDGRLGADRMDRFDEGGRTSVSGAATATVTPADSWGISAGVSREPLFDTARLIHNNVHVSAVSANAWWTFANRWTLRGGLQRGAFSDGNDRNVATGSIEVRLPLAHPHLTLGAAGRYVAYANGSDLPRVPVGYFSPDNFFSYVATASLADSFARKRFYWAADVQAGVQDFSVGGESNGGDDVFAWNLLTGWNITRNISAEAWFGRSDYAQQVSSGFNTEHYGFLFRFRL